MVHSPWSTVSSLSTALLVWLVSVEIGVQAWYYTRESRIVTGPDWIVDFPTYKPGFKELPIATATESLLRFDEAKQAAWVEDDGTSWSAFYFNWVPGRVAGYLAKRHTPDICMPAAGLHLRPGNNLEVVNVKGIVLPMRLYIFEGARGPTYVFQARWEAGASAAAHVAQESARFNLIRAVWAGRGNKGQKVLELIVTGAADEAQAKELLVKQLERIVVVDRRR